MPSSDFVATLVCNGVRYTAWTSVMVKRDYGNSVSIFEFTAAEPGSSGSYTAVKLKPGDPVQVYLGADKVIDGSVTTRTVSMDMKSHDLVIAGKSFTQELDSSCKVQPGTLNGSTFQQAANSVLGPTGVGLVIKNPPAIASKPFANLSIQYGERVIEFIERIARMRGLFLTDDENGNLVASQVQPSAPVAALQEGFNILRAVCTLDNQAAWSSLNGVSQQPGTDGNYPPRDYSATVSNPNATTNRTSIFIVEGPADAQDTQQRVQFEAANAAWGHVNCSITVVGWHRPDGSIWNVTDPVTVLAPSLFPSESGAVVLGVQACVYRQDSENGTTTTLELKEPGALTTLPNPVGAPATDPVTNPTPAAATVDPPDMSVAQPAYSST